MLSADQGSVRLKRVKKHRRFILNKMILLGLEITAITVGIFLVVSALFFYVIYSYLCDKSKDEADSNKTTIYIYSIVPSIIIGILFVFVYEKYLKKAMTNKQELLQEDFYS